MQEGFLRLASQNQDIASLFNRLVKNFYIQAVVKSRKFLPGSWDIKKVLVDPSSTWKLIPQRVIVAMNWLIYPEKPVTMVWSMWLPCRLLFDSDYKTSQSKTL